MQYKHQKQKQDIFTFFTFFTFFNHHTLQVDFRKKHQKGFSRKRGAEKIKHSKLFLFLSCSVYSKYWSNSLLASILLSSLSHPPIMCCKSRIFSQKKVSLFCHLSVVCDDPSQQHDSMPMYLVKKELGYKSFQF